MKKIKNEFTNLLSYLLTLAILCGLLFTTLWLIGSGQINLWIYLFSIFALPSLLIYLLVFTICHIVRINRLLSIGTDGCFLSALLYICVIIVWNRCMFSPDINNFTYLAIIAIMGQGLLFHAFKYFTLRNKKISQHKVLSSNKADRVKIRNKIVVLFIRNMAMSALVILPIQFFSSAPYVPQWDAWDLSEFKWAENLFSMSCTLWVIAAVAYFLRLNRDVLTSKRVQATMAAIFLICGLATTLLFKNTILVWSALAAPIIYLLFQNRHSKTNARDLSHSS